MEQYQTFPYFLAGWRINMFYFSKSEIFQYALRSYFGSKEMILAWLYLKKLS